MRGLLSIFRQIGFDPIRAVTFFRFAPKYFRDLIVYMFKARSLKVKLRPIFIDYAATAGSADGHYFWQDLICARWIYEDNPEQHFDVGSRVDGFIAHLLTSRTIIQLDIRDQPAKIEGLQKILGDAQKDLSHLNQKFESVSSLHSIEHFGLGRYSDKIEPDGHIKGVLNISTLVSTEGKLYLSFPIGRETVEFNAQRILNPKLPIDLLPNFELEEFVLIPWKGEPIRNYDPNQVDVDIWGQAGLYKFKRKHD